MNTKTEEMSGYTLTWFVPKNEWFGFPDTVHKCVMLETIVPINDVQHMISRYCPCGGIEKWISK